MKLNKEMLYQLPKTRVDEEREFYFKIYDWRTDGLIFAVSALIIPLFCLLLLRFAFNMGIEGSEPALPALYQGLTILSSVIGGVFIFRKNSSLFIKSGLFIFYIALVFLFFVSFIGSLLVMMLPLQEPVDQDLTQLILMWAQVIGELIVVVIGFWKVTDLKERIIQTIKQNWIQLIIVLIVGLALMFGIGVYLYGLIDSSSSTNNDTLLNGLNGPYRVTYIITLLVFTVFVAPLFEEMTYRHGIFAGCGNRWLSVVVSTILFAMIHVSSGDVEHIGGYLINSFFLVLIFNYTRGNITYSWMAHMAYNFIAFVLAVVN